MKTGLTNRIRSKPSETGVSSIPFSRHRAIIIVAVVATVATIGPAQAQDLAAKRVAPEIGAGYSIAAEERRPAAYPRRPPSQQSQDDLAAKRVAPEIGSAGYSIATEERRHAAYPRRGWHYHR